MDCGATNRNLSQKVSMLWPDICSLKSWLIFVEQIQISSFKIFSVPQGMADEALISQNRNLVS
jgi:hypothetical protein